MKHGKFFHIPECPADLDHIRRLAAPLNQSTRPSWLDAADEAYYRYVGKKSCTGLSPSERTQLFAEIEELEMAGLVADHSAVNEDVRHIYISSSSQYEVWSIGIYRGISPLALHPASTIKNPVVRREHVTDVPAEIVADPFIIKDGHSWFMFFEVLNWRENKGEIGLAASDDALHWTYQKRVLVEPFHLSYPYVFTAQGEFYMVPETHQAESVRLYRAVDFPTKWTFVTTLLNGRYLADPSIFFHDDKWWMLVATNPGQHDTLRLYFADSLRGPWEEHPLSPIVHGNPHIARPAGRVLIQSTCILRFAQDCRPAYGRSVRAFEIRKLTTTAYHEVEVKDNPILGPSGGGWNACGMHHIDAHKCEDGTWLASVDGWTRGAHCAVRI